MTLGGAAAQGQQTAKLVAADAAAGDRFGFSVSISGDTAVVGANYTDGVGLNSGSAYVFRNIGGVWQQAVKLTAADAAAADEFGFSVSISGDTAVIGARLDDDVGDGCGSAYAFREVGGVWQQAAKLIAGDGAVGDQFGFSVSVSGDTAVVGARSHGARGSAYVYREVGGVWTQIAQLNAADGAYGDNFGFSVSLSGDTIVVGAYYAGSGNGSAYVFREVGGVWQQTAKLIASDTAPGDNFGYSVSISGNAAVIGAPLDDDAGDGSGSAYAFREIGGVWQQIAKLIASDGAAGDSFGNSVSISGDTAVIGAKLDDGSGSAYAFRDVGGVWQQTAKLIASDAAPADAFGISVSISSGTAVVGAFQDDDAGSFSGSAYVFGVVCLADFNEDLVVNTLDMLAFLNAWAAGDPSADINGDGNVNTLDVLAFLNLWVAGC